MEMQNNGLCVRKMNMYKPHEQYQGHLKSICYERPELSQMSENMPPHTFLAVELYGNNSHAQFKKLCEEEHDKSFRIRFGGNIYYSNNSSNSNVESQFVFQDNRVKLFLCSSALFKNSTLCIIKPHALREGNMGKIISQIQANGFIVSALKMFHFARSNCEEFLDVYKGVVPEYESMVMQMISGDCVGLEIVNKYDDGISTYQSFRNFCGPVCPSFWIFSRK
ncbi:nucleoside diphosphate kinase 7 isoform X2 [Uranotaenia lowii]|uniref:nucleoside diphosphate kinase 7 isoform X2 n=1 Tax=Uranotaenia lowii TaxID=190385 RepID=UPI00247AB234|nr:nucleoside diphosphate kinase 7 isoform X2 [Uranotaenia lowii]